jgi:hypothetical protein
MVNLQTIFSWFSTGKKPTEEQFRDTWSSFWHKSEHIPYTQILGVNMKLFVEKNGINARIYPKYFRYMTDITVANVILAGNAAAASFSIGGTTYDATTIVGVTLPAETDLVIEDIDIEVGYDTGSLTIVF